MAALADTVKLQRVWQANLKALDEETRTDLLEWQEECALLTRMMMLCQKFPDSVGTHCPQPDQGVSILGASDSRVRSCEVLGAATIRAAVSVRS